MSFISYRPHHIFFFQKKASPKMLSSQFPFLSKNLHVLSLLLFLYSCSAQSSSYTNTTIDPKHVLVYKNCGNNSVPDSPNPPQEILTTLFQELVEQSSKSKFYKTSIGDENYAISGLYQCRNDLSPDDCQSCVNQIPKSSKALCGTQIPSRIHLSGCYLQYKQEGYETSRLEVQHKKCGEERSLEGFGEIRQRALEGVGDCIVEGEGYCDMRHEGIHLLAQCGGDLGKCECGECIGNAEELLGTECKYSISGEVYLDGCFVSYNYHEDVYYPGYSNRDYGERRDGKGKLIAIVVGGVALLSLGLVFLYFIRSRSKSDW